MSLRDAILNHLALATSQRPLPRDALCKRLEVSHPGTPVAAILRALEDLLADRMLTACAVTRDGQTQDVYWPTGRKSPVISGVTPHPKPIIHSNLETTVSKPEIVPNEETYASRLKKVIIAQGPIIGADLATAAGVPAKNIDPYLLSAVKSGTICTRMGVVAALGKERKHYMTAHQADEWDARAASNDEATRDPARHQGSMMSHPLAEAARGVDSPAAERDALLALIGARDMVEAQEMVHAVRSEMHDLKNEVAARTMIMQSLAETMDVEHHEEIPEALAELMATRATAVPSQGTLAMILIDSDDLTDIEMIASDDLVDAEHRARAAVEDGHAARAVVVRVLGEARRTVAWDAA